MNFENYIVDNCGFDVYNATITDDEIRAYFTAENFTAMFGAENADLPAGMTFEGLANEAISLRDKYAAKD